MANSKLLISASLAVVLAGPWWCFAQQPQNTDQIRKHVRQLESMKTEEKAPSIQETHQRSLLSLYRQFQVVIQEDITSLENMKAVVPARDTAVHDRIARQIRDLTDEWNATVDKIRSVSSHLQPSPGPTTATVRGSRRARNPNATPTNNSEQPLVTPAEPKNGPESAATNGSSSGNGYEKNSSAAAPAETGPGTLTADADAVPPSAPAATPTATPTGTPQPFVFSATDLASCNPQAPSVLLGSIETTANSMVFDENPDALSGQFPKIFVYSVLGGLSEEIGKLDRYRYMGETARTDVQVGASAKSGGSTSAIEKPGISELLTWAIEHGAITKEVNDTVLTLSSSPYALFAAANGDTPKTYQDYNFFNRLGVSASFNINNDNPSVLASARRKQLREWSARFRFTPDRSTRSADFSTYWERDVKPAIEQRLLALSSTESAFNADPSLRNLSDTVEAATRAEIDAYIAKNPITATTNKTERARAIGKIILCKAHSSIFIPVNKPGAVEISPQIRARIPQLVKGLSDAHDAVNLARESLKKYLNRLEEQPLGTFAYTNQRTDTGSDYSVFQFLYERKAFAPMKLVANAGMSFYHKPANAIKQQTVRDFNLALSFEGKTRSPFVSMEEDLSNITYSFTGSYQRLFENRGVPGKRADISVAQFKIEFPIAMGFRLPFSVTYASATETSKKREVRANFGFNLDTLKLLALRRLASMALGND